MFFLFICATNFSGNSFKLIASTPTINLEKFFKNEHCHSTTANESTESGWNWLSRVLSCSVTGAPVADGTRHSRKDRFEDFIVSHLYPSSSSSSLSPSFRSRIVLVEGKLSSVLGYPLFSRITFISLVDNFQHNERCESYNIAILSRVLCSFCLPVQIKWQDYIELHHAICSFFLFFELLCLIIGRCPNVASTIRWDLFSMLFH